MQSLFLVTVHMPIEREGGGGTAVGHPALQVTHHSLNEVVLMRLP